MCPKFDVRPLPQHLVVAAFPTAYRQSRSTSFSTERPGDFFLIQASPADIELSRADEPWLTLSPPKALCAGLSRVDYRASDNTLAMREQSVTAVVHGKSYQLVFRQQAGELVQEEMVHTLNAPLNIDFLVAITFIADLIKKISVTYIQVLAAIIAIVAIVVLAFVISALRHSFLDVPEPKPLSTDTNGVPIVLFPGVSIPEGLPLDTFAAEDQTIALQTVKEIYWLVKQAF